MASTSQRDTSQSTPAYEQAEEELRQAFAAHEQKDGTEAIREMERHFRACIARDPEGHNNVHGHLAWLLYENYRYEEAVQSYLAFLEENPKNSVAHYYAGMSLLRSGRSEEACRHFIRSLPGSFPQPRFWSALGRAAIWSRPGRWVSRCYRSIAVGLTGMVASCVDAIRGEREFGTGRYLSWAKRYWPESIHWMSYSRSAEYAFAFRKLAATSNTPIFDIGTGTSAFIAYAADTGLTIYGSDYDAYMEELPKLCPRVREPEMRSRLMLLRANGMALPVPDNSLRHVLCISTIEHIPDDGDLALMREIGRALAPGGRAVVTTEGAEKAFFHWSRMPFHVGFQYREDEENEAVPESGESSWGFYRFYDEDALRDRLATVEGLRCLEYGFLHDRFGLRPLFPDHQTTLVGKLIHPWKTLLGRVSYVPRPCPLKRKIRMLGSVGYVILEKPEA